MATWIRAFCYTGLRVGLYPSVKGLLGADSGALSWKIASGATTGALAAMLGSPVDLVTETDVRCEQLVAARIRAAFPEHALIGEESAEDAGGTGSVELPGNTVFWWVGCVLNL